jgi:hypothetical protein
MNNFNEPIFMENKKLFRQGAVLVTHKKGGMQAVKEENVDQVNICSSRHPSRTAHVSIYMQMLE